MKEHIIKPKFYNYLFSPNLAPVAKVDPGDVVHIYTDDAFASQIQSESDIPSQACANTDFFNPQTGPIYINGAEPGDTLVVNFIDIEFTRDHAVTANMTYFGGLQSTGSTRMLQPPLKEEVWFWDVIDGGKNLHCKKIGVTIPAKPFCGTLAVAPNRESITAVAPGYFGGNMDVPDVCPGNKIYLPVHNEGALFYIGDCHASQGDGEITGVACEITAKCTVSFEVIKNKSIAWPRIESEDEIMVVGSAKPMEDAARIAYVELIHWMVEEYGFEMMDAYMLLAQVGGLYVGNMVDSTYSLVASVKKDYLEQHRKNK